MQQGARDLDAAHLAAGQRAHLVAHLPGEIEPLQQPLRRGGGRRGWNAVERRMIGQVLDHAQIEIEGAGLEHHAQPAQRLAGVALQSWPRTRIVPSRMG